MNDLLSQFLNGLAEKEKTAEEQRQMTEYLSKLGGEELLKLAQAPGMMGPPPGTVPGAPPPGPAAGGSPISMDASQPPQQAAAQQQAMQPPPPDPMQVAEQIAIPAVQARVQQLQEAGVDPQTAGVQAGTEAASGTVGAGSKDRQMQQKAMQKVPQMGAAAPQMGGPGMGGGPPSAPSMTPPTPPGGAGPASGMPKMATIKEKAAEADRMGREKAHLDFQKLAADAGLDAATAAKIIAAPTAAGVGLGLLSGTARLGAGKSSQIGRRMAVGGSVGGAIGAGTLGLVALGNALNKADPSGRTLKTVADMAPAALMTAGALQGMSIEKKASKGKAVGLAAGSLAVGSAATLGAQRGVREHREAKIEKALTGSGGNLGAFYKANPKRREEVATFLSKMPKKKPVGVHGRVSVAPVSDRGLKTIKSYRKAVKKYRRQQMKKQANVVADTHAADRERKWRDSGPQIRRRSARRMFGKSYNELTPVQQKKVWDAFQQSGSDYAKKKWLGGVLDLPKAELVGVGEKMKKQATVAGALTDTKRLRERMEQPGLGGVRARQAAFWGAHGMKGYNELRSMKKQAYMVTAEPGPKPEGADELWSDKFQGTEMHEPAKQLEMQDAQTEMQNAQQQAQDDQQRQARYQEQDQLRAQKNMLEAQLKLQQLQEQMAPAPEEGAPPAEGAPQEQAPEQLPPEQQQLLAQPEQQAQPQAPAAPAAPEQVKEAKLPRHLQRLYSSATRMNQGELMRKPEYVKRKLINKAQGYHSGAARAAGQTQAGEAMSQLGRETKSGQLPPRVMAQFKAVRSRVYPLMK